VALRDSCQVIDAATGRRQQEIHLPQNDSSQQHHWGYIARSGEMLVGSGRKPTATYNRQSRQNDLELWYDKMRLVTSDYLFALRTGNVDPAWTYGGGIVINTTLAIGGKRLYFLESHAPAAVQSATGRLPMADFQHGPCFIVALDIDGGHVLWKRPFDLTDFQHIAYINYAQEKLIVSGNRYREGRLWYFFQGIDAATGDELWRQSHNSGYARGGDHGEQNRHPTIVANTVYTYPLAYDLHTGERRADWEFDRLGHGCGNISASAGCIFWRGDNPWQRSLHGDQSATRVNGVNRPGCYINMIPAGGLLLIPEASSGCTCGFPLQTSLAYVPAGWLGGD
jgi:hypothetical protein